MFATARHQGVVRDENVMATYVSLVNDRTGEVKRVKVGWSWVLFLFSGFLGIPLFARKLYRQGIGFLILWILTFVALANSPADAAIFIFAFYGVLSLAFQIMAGVSGNKMTGIKYLEKGWSFQEADGVEATVARHNWKLVKK